MPTSRKNANKSRLIWKFLSAFPEGTRADYNRGKPKDKQVSPSHFWEVRERFKAERQEKSRLAPSPPPKDEARSQVVAATQRLSEIAAELREAMEALGIKQLSINLDGEPRIEYLERPRLQTIKL